MLLGNVRCDIMETKELMVSTQHIRNLVTTLILLGCYNIFAAETNSSLPLLETAKQVITLSNTEANKNYPVQLEGVITFFNFTDALLFIQDKTSGVYVYPYRQYPYLKPGNIIKVIGTTKSGIYAPVVIATQIQFVGDMLIPTPKTVTIDQIKSGLEDSQWVEFEGVVQKEYVQNQLVLEIAEFEDNLTTRIYDFPSDRKDNLLDHRVKVRGVIATEHDDKRQVVGFHMLISSLADVTLIEPPIADPFSLPVKMIREINAFPTHGVTGHRIRINGTVTLQRQDGVLFIEDQTGGIQVQTSSSYELIPGDVLDIVGFVSKGLSATILVETHLKKVRKDLGIKPQLVQIQDLLKGLHNNQLIEINAYLVDVLSLDPLYTTLLMQKETKTFQVHLPQKGLRHNFKEPSGSHLRIRGVCQTKRDFYQRPNGWDIWLRNEKDIQVLQRPGQWYIQKITYTIFTVAIGLLAILVWLIILRRQVKTATEVVHRREQELESRYRELFENANDIIFSIDLEGNIQAMNQAGLKIFGYDGNEIKKINIRSLAMDQEQPKITELLTDAKMAGINDRFELMLQTKERQRIFIELKYRPDLKEGEITGLRCIARDVTARKQDQMALSQSERQLRHLLTDREKLSRDLHDDIIQSIYGVGLGLEECRRYIPGENVTLVTKLNRVRDQLNQLIRNVRRFLGGQTPDILSHGLTRALETLVIRMNDTQSMRCILDVDEMVSQELNIEEATQIFYIAQEALSNSIKYSRAQTAFIMLKKRDGNIRFEIQDDGCGFNPYTLSNPGYGLKNMEARAEELKGRFNLNSFPGKGTKILVEFPTGHTDE